MNEKKIALEAQFENCTRPILHTEKQKDLFAKALKSTAVYSAVMADPERSSVVEATAKKTADADCESLNTQMVADHVNELLELGKKSGGEAVLNDWLAKRFVPQYRIKGNSKKNATARSLVLGEPAEITLESLMTASATIPDLNITSRADWRARLDVLKENMMIYHATSTDAEDGGSLSVPPMPQDIRDKALSLGYPYCAEGDKSPISKNAINAQMKDVFSAILISRDDVQPCRKDINVLAPLSINAKKKSGLYFMRSDADQFSKFFIAYLWNRVNGIDLSVKEVEDDSSVKTVEEKTVEVKKSEPKATKTKKSTAKKSVKTAA